MSRLSNQNFEGSGYDNNESWTEYVASGCILDEDFTHPGGLPAGGAQCLRSYIVANGDYAYARLVKTAQSVNYARFFFYVQTNGLDNNKGVNTVDLSTSSDVAARIQFYVVAGIFRVRFGYYTNGALTWTSGVVVSAQQWYRVDFKYDSSGMTWEWMLDQTSRANGSLTGSVLSPDRASIGIVTATDGVFDIYIDGFAWDNSGWAKGPAEYVDLDPNGDTATVEWSVYGGSGDHHTRLIDSNDETYVYSDGGNDLEELYTLEDLPTGWLTNHDVATLRMWMRIQQYSATARHMSPMVKMSGVSYKPRFVCPASVDEVYSEWQENPNADAPWGAPAVNNMELGFATFGTVFQERGGRVNKLWVQIVRQGAHTAGILVSGPILGNPTSSSIKMRVRTSKACSVYIRYGTVEADVKNAASGTFTTSPQTSGSTNNYWLEFELTSLSANTTYYFDVIVDEISTSLWERTYNSGYWTNLPSFKTFASSISSFTFGIVTDLHSLGLDPDVHASLADDNPLFILNLGDHIDGNTDIIYDLRFWFNKTRGSFSCENLYFMKNIMSKFGQVFGWSDHDGPENNCHKFGYGDYGQSYTFGSWARVAKQRSEFFPLPTLAAPTANISGTATGGSSTTLINSGASFLTDGLYPGMVVIHDPDGENEAYSFIDSVDSNSQIILSQALSGSQAFSSGDTYVILKRGFWYKFSVGDAEFFVLDTRAKRDPNNTNYGDMLDGRKYLGDSYGGSNDDNGGGAGSGHIQRDWLVTNLNGSAKKWKFIVCEYPFKHDMVSAPEANDKWSDYDQYDSLRNYLVSNITAKNVIWLGGDRHCAALNDASHANDPWPELLCPASFFRYDVGKPTVQGAWLVDSQDAEYDASDGLNAGYALVTVGASAVVITVYDQDGVMINNGVRNLTITINASGATIQAAAADGVSLGDTPTRTAKYRANVMDGLSLGDAGNTIAQLLSELADGLKLSDTPTRTVRFPVGAAGGISLGDGAAVREIAQALLSDGVSFGDMAAVIAALVAVGADGISLDDSAETIAQFRAQAAEGIVLSDSTVASLLGAILAECADGVVLGDSISATLQALASAADGITLSDSAARRIITAALAADGIAASDATVTLLRALASAADGITLSDSGEVRATFRVECADGAQFADTIAIIAKLAATVSDGVVFSDSATDPSQLAKGYVSVTFSVKQATVTFLVKKPEVAFIPKKPGVDFTAH